MDAPGMEVGSVATNGVGEHRPGPGSMIDTRVEAFDAAPWARRFNIAMKVGIVVAFAVALLVPLDHLEGKGMGFRAPLFIGSAVVVPLMQRFRRVPRRPYPHLGDGLLVAPFLLDTLGNLLGFYNDYAVTDDVLHLANWVLLVASFMALRYRRTAGDDDAVLTGAGIGALAIVVWELIEWGIAETGAGGGLQLTYGDTIGDLALSSSGGLIGALIGRYVFSRAAPPG